jgi:hypothetical protein
LTSGVHELTTYFVVFSGSYIYFYKDEQDLMPAHYIYVMSISAQKKGTKLILRSRNEQVVLDFGESEGLIELNTLINEKQQEFRLGEEAE